ncbi:MAG: nucleotidyltransferase family protein [Myxococcota bacterium]
MDETRALLLAAGRGTRLRPVTDQCPKCLVPIAGRPLLDYWFEALARAGIRDVLVNTHHLRDQVQGYLRGLAPRFRVVESFEPSLLGSAGTIHAHSDWLDGARDGLIVYADNLSNVDLPALLRFHRSHPDPITMAVFRTPHPSECGIVGLDDEGRVIEFVEKPARPASDLANAGLYVASRAGWREIAEADAFDLGFDVLPRFVGRMRAFLHGGYHLDIRDPGALDQARVEAPGVFGATGGARRGA